MPPCRTRLTITRRRRAPHLRLLARLIFGLTTRGIAAGLWFSLLDAGGFETDLAFLLSFCLFPIIGYILAIRRPDNAISGHLRFAVIDDRRGSNGGDELLDGVQGMADRLDAIGGVLHVVLGRAEARPIEGRIPTPTSPGV